MGRHIINRARLVAALLTLALAASGCGVIEARREQRERISNALDRVIDAGSATYRISMQWTRQPRGGTRIEAPAPLVLEGEMGFEDNRAIAYLDGDRARVAALYDGAVIYVPKASEPTVPVGFDFDRRQVSGLGGEQALGFLWVNPVYLFRFADGSIPDTIRSEGTEGTMARYKAGVDRDAAIRGALQGLQIPFRHQLRAMNIDAVSFPDSDFLLDGGGALRKFTMTFPQRINDNNIFDTQVTMEILQMGGASVVATPDHATLAQAFSELTRSASRLRT